MLGRIVLLFLLVGIAEVVLLVRIGQHAGFWSAAAIVAVSGFAGVYLSKRMGLSVWRRFNERLHRGEVPGRELIDGVVVLVSGLLLITPGVMTDLVGFAGLLPFTRAAIMGLLTHWIRRAVQRGSVHLTVAGFQTFGTNRDGDRRGVDDRLENESEWQGRPRDLPGHRKEE